jgi:predicted protein tyrosine phosphatase
VSQELLDWADVVFCMENKHAATIRHKFSLRVPVVVLDIADDFVRDDPELVAILHQKLERYLAE